VATNTINSVLKLTRIYYRKAYKIASIQNCKYSGKPFFRGDRMGGTRLAPEAAAKSIATRGLAGMSLVSCKSRTSRHGSSLTNILTSAMAVPMPSTFHCKTWRPRLTPPTRSRLVAGLTSRSLTASRAWFLMHAVHSQCLLLFHMSRAPGVRPEHLIYLWYWALHHWQIKGTDGAKPQFAGRA
jgi:hypothetical protein